MHSAFVAAMRTLSAQQKRQHQLHVCLEEADSCIVQCCQDRYFAAIDDLGPRGLTEHPYV
jgi:hypothetical protein